ncbi:MAG: hypothetical protein IKU28_08880 [Erysipelotrichaceae bacterium]|nr:hypothetical protein [Erysipelotrichaceae bacterium]
MTLNNLDTWFSKNKVRCCILFLLFSVFYLICDYYMIAASNTVVLYSNPYDYMLLFESAAVDSFLLGKLIFNAMEYLYAGQNVLWIVLKSIDPIDVFMVSAALIILFQDSDHVYCTSMKLFTAVLVIAGLLFLVCYGCFLFVASMQLTTEAGFDILRAAGEIGRFSGLVLMIVCLLMNVALWIMKEEKVGN